MKTRLRLKGFLLSAALLAASCGALRIPGTNSATSSGSKDNSSAASVQPSGDPREDVKQALTKLLAAKSWRARLTTTAANVIEIEFAAPNRFHTKGQSNPEGQPFPQEMIIVGDDIFMRLGNAGWRKMPIILGINNIVQQVRHSDVVQEMLKYEEVKFVGHDVLDGAPMLVYQYKTKNTETDGVTIPAGLWKIWISASDGLPRKNESQRETDSEGKPVKTKMNVIYSDYDADIKIEPPV